MGWVEDNATPAIAYLHALHVLTNTLEDYTVLRCEVQMALALKPKKVAPSPVSARHSPEIFLGPPIRRLKTRLRNVSKARVERCDFMAIPNLFFPLVLSGRDIQDMSSHLGRR